MSELILSKFAGVSTGSIDYSPYQPASVVTIILDEEELATATDGQFERFWRVWYKERSFYAPKLQTLVIGLRNSSGSWKGIHRFLNYFEFDVYSRAPRVGLEMYDSEYRCLINITSRGYRKSLESARQSTSMPSFL